MFILATEVLAPMVDKLARHSRLGSAEINALLSMPFRTSSVDRDAYLVREGDKVASCTVLLSGFIYRSKIAGSGSRQILSIHQRGDMIDLQNGLLDHADHNVQALTRTEVAYIPHQTILDVANEYPAVARALWRDTLIDGSVFREWILNVGQRDARQRISHLICETALRQEDAGICQGPQYLWPLTQEQVGDAMGLTAVHVNRTIQYMRNDGLIVISKGSVTIPDWRRLQLAGDFSKAYLQQDPVPKAELRSA